MNTEMPANDVEALALALALAITAPTNREANEVLDMAVQISDRLTKSQIQEAKDKSATIVAQIDKGE